MLSKSRGSRVNVESNCRESRVKVESRCAPVECVNVSKSLGVMIDENLTWHCHVDLITKKVNSGLYVLKRLRDLVNVETLLAVYKTLIQTHFDYCSQVWGCLGTTLQNKLQRLQNRAVRTITKQGYEYRSADIQLNELGFIPALDVRRNNQLCMTMYQVKNNFAPQYLTDLFCKTSSIHDYNTRFAQDALALPKPNSNSRKKSFSYKGAVACNNFPSDLKKIGSLLTFKRSISVSNVHSPIVWATFHLFYIFSLLHVYTLYCHPLLYDFYCVLLYNLS